MKRTGRTYAATADVYSGSYTLVRLLRQEALHYGMAVRADLLNLQAVPIDGMPGKARIRFHNASAGRITPEHPGSGRKIEDQLVDPRISGLRLQSRTIDQFHLLHALIDLRDGSVNIVVDDKTTLMFPESSKPSRKKALAATR